MVSHNMKRILRHAMNYGCGTQPVLTREFCQEKKRINMRTCSSIEFKTTIRLQKLSGFGKPRVLRVNPGYLNKTQKNFGYGFVRYIYIYIYLSLYLSVYLSVYVSTHLYLYLSWCLTICLCVHVSICLSRHLFLQLSL